MSMLAISSAALLAATPVTSNVAMFERVAMNSELRLYTVGVLEDTRCPDRELCFRDERLIVATVVLDGKRRTGIAMELGVPLRIAGGWLTLVATTATPRQNGAIPLSKYGLTYRFVPDL